MRWPWQKKSVPLHPADEWSYSEVESSNAYEQESAFTPEPLPSIKPYDMKRHPGSRVLELEADNEDLMDVFDLAKQVLEWRDHPERLQTCLDSLRDAVESLSYADPDDPELSTENRRPAAPTGSVEAQIMARYAGELGFDLAPHQRHILDGFTTENSIDGWMFRNPPVGDLTELKLFAEEQGKRWSSPALQAAFMVKHFGADGGAMAIPADPAAYEAALKAQQGGQDQGTEPRQGIEFLQKKIEERE
jgi:hypothetical protein